MDPYLDYGGGRAHGIRPANGGPSMIFRAERMYGVDHRLVSIVLGAGVLTSFYVTEGLRTKDRQAELVLAGKSQTMTSKHLIGHAVDLAVCNQQGIITWDFELYRRLADVMYDVAHKHGVRIKWGGEWTTLRDGPHFELVENDNGVQTQA